MSDTPRHRRLADALRSSAEWPDDPALAHVVPVVPPDSLRARLMERIRAERFEFVRAEEGKWVRHGAVSSKMLYDGGVGARTQLMRLEADDATLALGTTQDPAIIVIGGELWRDAERLQRGDFAQRDAATRGWHAVSATTVLVIERAENGTRASRRGAGSWRTIAAGTRMRVLSGGDGETVDVMLLEMDAGGVLPEHDHAGLEEIFVLGGSCQCQGRRVAAGDYHRAGRGSEHDATTTDEGCLMVVVVRRAA